MELRTLIVHNSSRSKSLTVGAHKKEAKQDVVSLEMAVRTLSLNTIVMCLFAVAPMEKSKRKLSSCCKITHINTNRKVD